MVKIKVLPNQTAYDIALQEYGNVAGINWLIEDNNFTAVAPQLTAGDTLNIRFSEIVQSAKEVATSSKNIDNITNLIATEVQRRQGLGYFILNKDKLT